MPRKSPFLLLVVCLTIASVSSLSNARASAPSGNEPARGQLKIEGTHVNRLLLERDDGHTEDWTNVSGSIELPVGTYQVKRLTLKNDYSCRSQSLTKLGPIVISADAPAVLKAGGPLQQSIGIDRRGRMLNLSYRVHGIGGEEYTPRSAAHAKFTAYRGGTVVGTGAFEYG